MQLAAKSMDGKSDFPIPGRPSVKEQTKASLSPQCLWICVLIELAHSSLLWVQHKHLTLKRRVQMVSKDIIVHPYRIPYIFVLFWGVSGDWRKEEQGVGKSEV